MGTSLILVIRWHGFVPHLTHVRWCGFLLPRLNSVAAWICSSLVAIPFRL